MQTFQEQRDFFFENWPAMKAALEQGGAAAAISFINDTFEGDLERRVMFSFARTGVVMEQWEGRSLDAYIPIAEAGIAELLRQAEAAENEETRNKRINGANVISYNLGADLAYCWDDGFERTKVHFIRGEQAGDDCLRWREQLGNAAYTFSMAYWLRGIHRLALEKHEGALEDFRQSLSFAEKAAAGDGRPTSLEEGDGSIVLGHGFVSLTQLIMGDVTGKEMYDQVIAIFTAQLEGDDENLREDAKWYLMQLQKVEQMHLGAEATGK